MPGRRTSLITDPAERAGAAADAGGAGAREARAARARRASGRRSRKIARSYERCLSARQDRRCCRRSTTRLCRSCRPRDRVLIVTEMIHDARVVRMNGRAPAAGDPAVARRLGRPLGRRHAGRRHHQLHRQDALPPVRRRPARGRALHAGVGADDPLRLHVEDPATYTRPWSGQLSITRTDDADLRVRLPRGELLDDRHPARRAVEEKNRRINAEHAERKHEALAILCVSCGSLSVLSREANPAAAGADAEPERQRHAARPASCQWRDASFFRSDLAADGEREDGPEQQARPSSPRTACCSSTSLAPTRTAARRSTIITVQLPTNHGLASRATVRRASRRCPSRAAADRRSAPSRRSPTSASRCIDSITANAHVDCADRLAQRASPRPTR